MGFGIPLAEKVSSYHDVDSRGELTCIQYTTDSTASDDRRDFSLVFSLDARDGLDISCQSSRTPISSCGLAPTRELHVSEVEVS